MNVIERTSADQHVNRDELEDDGKQGLQATEHDIQNNTHDLEEANWNPKSVFNSKKALWAFLVLCYSVCKHPLRLSPLSDIWEYQPGSPGRGACLPSPI